MLSRKKISLVSGMFSILWLFLRFAYSKIFFGGLRSIKLRHLVSAGTAGTWLWQFLKDIAGSCCFASYNHEEWVLKHWNCNGRLEYVQFWSGCCYSLCALGIFVIYVLDLGTIFMFKHDISTLGLSDRAHFFKKWVTVHMCAPLSWWSRLWAFTILTVCKCKAKLSWDIWLCSCINCY
jgi:hypothetical protein